MHNLTHWGRVTHICISETLPLTHWGRVTHICVSKITIIVSDNVLSPGRRQGIIWTNAGILLIGPLGTNFSEILIGIQTFSFRKMHLKISSAKWRPFCLGLNELMLQIMACHLFSAKPLSEPVLPNLSIRPWGTYFSEIYFKSKSFHSRKCTWKYRLWNGNHFVSTWMCEKWWLSYCM